MSQVAGRRACTGVGTRMHDASIEGAGTAAKGVKRKRSGDVGCVGEDVGFKQREAEKSEHALRAVEEREAFFGIECDALDSGFAHRFAARELFVFEMGFAFADND